MGIKATFRIEDVFRIEGRGVVVTGTLIAGELRKGMKTSFNGTESVIMEMESKNQTMDEFSEAGGQVGILLSNVYQKGDVPIGQIVFE